MNPAALDTWRAAARLEALAREEMAREQTPACEWAWRFAKAALDRATRALLGGAL